MTDSLTRARMSPELQRTLDRVNSKHAAAAAALIAGLAEVAALTLFIGMALVWAAIGSGA